MDNAQALTYDDLFTYGGGSPGGDLFGVHKHVSMNVYVRSMYSIPVNVVRSRTLTRCSHGQILKGCTLCVWTHTVRADRHAVTAVMYAQSRHAHTENIPSSC